MHLWICNPKLTQRPFKTERTWTKHDFEKEPLTFTTKFIDSDVVILRNEKRERFIQGLLEINVSERLGSSDFGLGFSKDIKTHQYLKSIDWALIEEMKLQPCYKPNVFLDLLA